ncbi:hypothetical protein [sulfur-oxidizing endosymbiont of Gigantopelta aegis]|uniref:hypothetical protein n=1 Tax=sulfur-oxidizing endosymbiont of Gigantopelta aegis TaxID=2794934 RepID=UPI0018DDE145|nr:hypothetical protein [sulfur-oxidizing endosymbiont of Gigantopelta aegis]
MGKIDEVKEILTTLRVAMTIAFGVLVITIGSLLKRYDDALIDMLFWAGVVFSIFILGTIIALVVNISKKTKEIGEL